MKRQQGTFTETNDGYEARFVRHLSCSIERAWTLLTDPAELAKWFNPTEIDPRPGGRFNQIHGSNFMQGRVVRFEPPHFLEHTWWGEDAPGGGYVTWELFRESGGTRLVLTHRSRKLSDEPGRDMAGWHVLLDVLEDVVGGGRGEDHSPPSWRFEGTGEVRKIIVNADGRGAWARWTELRNQYALNLTPRIQTGVSEAREE